jgi:hypothetical protein
MTEKEKFIKWWNEKKQVGLSDFQVFVSPNAQGHSDDDVFAELNRMLNARDIQDLDIF